MPYLAKKQIRKAWGEFWKPGDIIPDSEIPKPQTMLRLGWIEKTKGAKAAKAPEPTPEPAAPPAFDPDPPIEDKPKKKKRGRPKKTDG